MTKRFQWTVGGGLVVGVLLLALGAGTIDDSGIFQSLKLSGSTNLWSTSSGTNLTVDGATYPSFVQATNTLGVTTTGLAVMQDTNGFTGTGALVRSNQPAMSSFTLNGHTNLVSDNGTQLTFGSIPIPQAAQFGVTLGDGVNVISTGVKTYWRVPYDLTVTGWSLVSSVSGDISVDVLNGPYATFPPVTSIWGIVPALSSAEKNQSIGLSIPLTNGDWIAYSVSGVTNITQATLALFGQPRSSSSAIPIPQKTQFGITIGDTVNVISTGVKAYWRVPYDLKVTGWDLVSSVSGDIAVSVLEGTYSGFPPTTSVLTTAPFLSGAAKNQSTGLSVSMTNGDWIAYSVATPTNVTQITLAIYGEPR